MISSSDYDYFFKRPAISMVVRCNLRQTLCAAIDKHIPNDNPGMGSKPWDQPVIADILHDPLQSSWGKGKVATMEMADREDRAAFLNVRR